MSNVPAPVLASHTIREPRRVLNWIWRSSWRRALFGGAR